MAMVNYACAFRQSESGKYFEWIIMNDNYDGNDDGSVVAYWWLTGFPAKWRLRNKRRHSILMTSHYPDLGSASDWLKQISLAARPIRSTTQIWLVTRHQYGISALVPETSFRRETSSGVAKCRRFLRLLTMMMLLMMTIITKMLIVVVVVVMLSECGANAKRTFECL